MKPLPPAPWLLLRCALQQPTAGRLPEARGSWQAPPIDTGHLGRYRAAIGFTGDLLPLSYHYLAVQRAQLAWMLQPGFPYRLLGMVHMAQRLERLGPWQRDQPFAATVDGQAEDKRHLLLRVELSQQDRVVVLAESRYRPPRDRSARPLRERAAEASPDDAPLARWRLDAAAGRRYAWISGDANPIHLGRWGARYFGLNAPIIHGAHTLARCEAELAPQGARHLEMRFLKPLALPGNAALHRDGDGYAVWGAAGRCAELELS